MTIVLKVKTHNRWSLVFQDGNGNGQSNLHVITTSWKYPTSLKKNCENRIGFKHQQQLKIGKECEHTERYVEN